MTPLDLSCFLRVMKLILGLAAFLLSGAVLANPIGGFVTLDQGQYIFIDLKTNRHLNIRAGKTEVLESLKKLKNLDYFQGQGEVVGNELVLDAIDFVGLRRLLGLWASNASAVLEFRDYSRVLIYRPFLKSLNPRVLTPKATMQYSIAPSTGLDWKIFFTDENQVQLASLTLQEERATLRFYDIDTGGVGRTIELSRVPGSR